MTVALAKPVETPIVVRTIPRGAYEPFWRAMQAFTDQRDHATADEIWFTEHEPVFTLGLNADRSHVLAAGDIPVVQTDRGGQVTYHGPGQLMIYPMIDLRRRQIGVRPLVTALEQSVVQHLDGAGIQAVARADAPGVYVDGEKVASVGLRVRRGASYHGMALNLQPVGEPFARINPCGFRGLEITSFAELGIDASRERVTTDLVQRLLQNLGLSAIERRSGQARLPV